MNILKNVRWGYTGDGMCCGPCGGSFGAEVEVETGDGKTLFIRTDRYDTCLGTTVADHSTMDTFLNMEEDPCDDLEGIEICGNAKDWYGDDPLYSAKNYCCYCLEQAEKVGEAYDCRRREYPGANEFAAQYMNRDLDEADIPPFRFAFQSDDEDEEDEE